MQHRLSATCCLLWAISLLACAKGVSPSTFVFDAGADESDAEAESLDAASMAEDASIEDATPTDEAADAALPRVGQAADGATTLDDGGGADGFAPECSEPPPPLINPEALPVCPGCAGGARCVPRAHVEGRAPELVGRLAECQAGSVCLPDPIITTTGFFKPTTCRSLNAAEGRCLSECLPEVASQRDVLPQDRCAAYERCVPCFDPLRGNATGACSLPCDVGPQEAATPFAACCGGAGSCVPPTLVPADQRSFLGSDSCAVVGALCAPSLFTQPDARPIPCSSIAGSEGRCMPTCLPSVGAQAARLPNAGCAAGEVCAPCSDPFTGQETSVCRIHGDAPVREPVRFESCCGSLGTCLPGDLVGQEDAKLLQREACTTKDALCVPNAFLDASFVPASCRSIADAEGRCVAACLLSEADRRVPLPQASCANGELCAPCFHPEDGTETGACAMRGDAPREPPVRFDTACCGTSGRCIPEELAGSGAKMLPADRCAQERGAGWLCAPKRSVEDPSRQSNPFATCQIDLGLFSVGRGKCVPRCMVEARNWVQRLLQRSSCESGELCVPCSLGGVPGC